MRTTIILDDSLVAQAKEMSGTKRISDLVRKGLTALIAEEARNRLVSFGGTDPESSVPPRR
jgi:Arc/MetJ family transcription regulator